MWIQPEKWIIQTDLEINWFLGPRKLSKCLFYDLPFILNAQTSMYHYSCEITYFFNKVNNSKPLNLQFVNWSMNSYDRNGRKMNHCHSNFIQRLFYRLHSISSLRVSAVLARSKFQIYSDNGQAALGEQLWMSFIVAHKEIFWYTK